MLTPFDTLELLVSKHEELEAAKAMLEQVLYLLLSSIVSVVVFYCIDCSLLLYRLFSFTVSIVLFY